MAQVIALNRNQGVDLEYVALLEDLLASARRGEDSGFVGLIERRNGKPRVVSRGSLAKDNARVASLVSQALDVFCLRAGISHPLVELRCPLPRQVKKA